MALPPELPRVEVVHELPDNDHHCHKDSAALKIIGEEVIEKLHGLPARIEVTRHVRRKYACPTCEEGMKTAPAPPKSNASATLLASISRPPNTRTRSPLIERHSGYLLAARLPKITATETAKTMIRLLEPRRGAVHLG